MQLPLGDLITCLKRIDVRFFVWTPASKTLEINGQSVVLSSWMTKFDPPSQQKLEKIWKQPPGEFSEDIVLSDSKKKNWKCLLIAGLKKEDGSLVGTLFDETKYRRTEDHLTAHSQSKDEFFVSLAHELKNPVNAVLGFAEILPELDPRSPEFQGAIDAIRRNAKNQNAFVEDLVDVSKLISGRFHIYLERVNLVQLFEEVMETLSHAIRAKKITMDFHVEGNLPEISADGRRIRQVFWNLLSNAVKYSRQGGEIAFHLKRKGDHIIALCVDDGEGIAPEKQKQVFESFWQEKMGAHGGMGVGLGLVRKLVEMHGGSVWVESEGLGQGSTFGVSFPICPPVVETESISLTRSNQDLALEKVKILAVDDSVECLLILKHFFERHGAEIETFEYAWQGLESLKSSSYDVLISDIEMPEMDGFEFVKRAKAIQPVLYSVALTGFDEREVNSRAADSGFDDVYSKPAQVDQIVAGITRRLSPKMRSGSLNRNP